ncbi:MAG: PHP-associated domain-containing protein [Thermoleophilaceae bacterium]
MPDSPCRVDLHCHSTASQVAKLGVQRALGLPECATPPEEVYELAKRRGMDFVTITDHDTISGALDIADRPDTFISEELTAGFKGEPQAVHVLCYGITPEDHEWLQAHAGDVEECAGYLHANEIACALAHPFFAVAAPLAPRHRRRLARLFPVWETRNGARAPELNLPAAIYIETHGGTGIAGSDDHAGIDIGRTFTETPAASCPEDFLRHLREGAADARGDQGSAAKLTHSAMGLAARALGAVAVGPPGAGPTGASAPEDARAATPSTAAAPPAPRPCSPWPSGSSAKVRSAAASAAPTSVPTTRARFSRRGWPPPASRCVAATSSPSFSPRTSPTPPSTAAPGGHTSAAWPRPSTPCWPPRPRERATSRPRSRCSPRAFRPSPTCRPSPSSGARRPTSCVGRPSRRAWRSSPTPAARYTGWPAR